MSESFRHIVRICGTDIEGSKKLPFGLAKIRGVGINFALAALRALHLDPETKIGYLGEEEVKRIEDAIINPQKYGLPGYLFNRQKDLEKGTDLHLYGAELDLRSKLDIDFLKEIRSWRGVRHSLGLKVRGQKTRTTGRKGKTVGVRKKVPTA